MKPVPNGLSQLVLQARKLIDSENRYFHSMGAVGTAALDVSAFLQAHVVRPGCTLSGYSHMAQQPAAMNTGHHILGC